VVEVLEVPVVLGVPVVVAMLVEQGIRGMLGIRVLPPTLLR
jgi:hypothetical protein